MPCFGFAQIQSNKYLEIKNFERISNHEKQQKIDSLFNIYEKNSLIEPLINDLYDYAKWHYGNTSIDQAITISERCIRTLENSSLVNGDVHKRVINNLGFFYRRKKDYYNAYKAYKELSTIGDIDRWTIEGYRLAGRNLNNLGDFYNASAYYENAIISSKRINDSKNLIKSCIDASVNYKQIATPESFQRGILLLTNVLRTIDDRSLPNIDVVTLDDMFLLNNHLGNLYNDRDDYDFVKSKLYYSRALDIALELKDSLSISRVYNDLGYLYLHDAKKETLKYLEQALKYKPSKAAISLIYGNKSYYYLKLKEYEKALLNAQLSINELTAVSITRLDDLPKKEIVLSNPFKYELLQSLIDKAETEYAFYNADSSNNRKYLTNALESLKLADYLADIIRLESNEPRSKLFWRKTASNVYSSAVKVCFYLDKKEDGFYFMEKNKALLLLEDVSLRQQRESATIPESIYEREAFLKEEILAQTKILEVALETDSLKNAMFNIKEKYSSFLDSLRENHQLFYQTKKPASIISLKEVQQFLEKNDKVYIEYILNKKDGYGMLISSKGTKLFEIGGGENLFERSQKLRKLLASPFKTPEDESLYMDLAYSIYKDLFPIEIGEEIKDKQLIIIPDSYLQNIPFEALYTSLEKGSYLIKKHEINYVYSLSFLEQNRNWERNNTNDFIGFAPVNFNNGLAELPESALELEKAGSLFSTVNYLYKDASTQNFIDQIKGYNIIHVASHANATDGVNPSISFDDKKLSLDDLYLTRNTANLVVLSACKTSIGTINEGEGVMSLARVFFNTGAQSVISTLWNVNDKSSSHIISDFYTAIKKGKTKSEALRIAKLNYLNTHELSEISPYYWSSLVLIGDSEAVPIRAQKGLFINLIIGFLVLIISVLVYFKLKK